MSRRTLEQTHLTLHDFNSKFIPSSFQS